MRKYLSKAVAIVAVVAVAIGAFVAVNHGTSDNSKVFESYNKYLEQKDLKAEYGEGTYDDTFPSKDAYFALAYIDNDSTPELLVRYTEDGSGGGTSNAGQIRGYKNGESHFILTLGDYEGKTRIYEKTGVVLGVESDEMGGYNAVHYELSNGDKPEMEIKSMLTYDSDAKKATYTVNDKEASEKEYNDFTEKLTQGTKGSKIVWHKNTAENRQEYLK